MNTAKFKDFITRLWLGKQTENAKIVFHKNKVFSHFKDKNTQVIGSISLLVDDDFGEDPIEVGVGRIDDLYNILSAMGDNISLTFNYNASLQNKVASITISDAASKKVARYMCVDTSVLTRVQELKKGLPQTDASIKINADFIDKYMSAFNALRDSDRFGIQCVNNELSIIINYNTIDVNSIKIDLGKSDNNFDVICFSAGIFNDILKSNKTIQDATLNITSVGLANLVYASDDYNATYYLLKKAIV